MRICSLTPQNREAHPPTTSTAATIMNSARPSQGSIANVAWQVSCIEERSPNTLALSNMKPEITNRSVSYGSAA